MLNTDMAWPTTKAKQFLQTSLTHHLKQLQSKDLQSIRFVFTKKFTDIHTVSCKILFHSDFFKERFFIHSSEQSVMALSWSASWWTQHPLWENWPCGMDTRCIGRQPIAGYLTHLAHMHSNSDTFLQPVHIFARFGEARQKQCDYGENMKNPTQTILLGNICMSFMKVKY